MTTSAVSTTSANRTDLALLLIRLMVLSEFTKRAIAAFADSRR